MPINLERLGYRMVKKNYDNIYVKPFSFNTGAWRTDRQTDGRTDGRSELLYQYRASVCWRAIKTDNLTHECLRLRYSKMNTFLCVFFEKLLKTTLNFGRIWNHEDVCRSRVSEAVVPHFRHCRSILSLFHRLWGALLSLVSSTASRERFWSIFAAFLPRFTLLLTSGLHRC